MKWTQWTITHFAVRQGCAVASFTTLQLRKADVTGFSHSSHRNNVVAPDARIGDKLP